MCRGHGMSGRVKLDLLFFSVLKNGNGMFTKGASVSN